MRLPANLSCFAGWLRRALAPVSIVLFGGLSVLGACSGVPTFRVAGADDAGSGRPADAKENAEVGSDAAADASADAAAHTYLTFVTADDYLGDFAAAFNTSDDIAQHGSDLCGRAWKKKQTSAGLPDDGRVWVALFFSDGARSPLDFLKQVPGGWYLPAPNGTGPLQFATLSDMQEGGLPQPFTTEYGEPVNGFVAWVGSIGSNANLLRCKEWHTASADAGAVIGATQGPDSWFKSTAAIECSQRAHLYCLEQ